jgi:DeoR family fructose operon transcriptional repressor
MLPEERFVLILETLGTKQIVTVAELSAITGASEVTIRRDLVLLEKQGKLKRVHGGASSLQEQMITVERTTAVKSTLNIPEKTAIAKYAAEQIHDDDFVYLDAGTTTLAMIPYLSHSKATFVTNGISQALTMAGMGLRSYVLGGHLKSSTEAIVGVQAMEAIRQYHFTKSFIGVNGISKKQGYTTPDIEEAKLKAKAIEQSYVSYVVADSSKFGQVCAVTIAPLDKACIITDGIADKTYKDCTIIQEVGK